MQRQNTTRNTGAEKSFSNESSFVVFRWTGITGDETINCHVAKNACEKIIAQLTGRQFINIKMKKSDNVQQHYNKQVGRKITSGQNLSSSRN